MGEESQRYAALTDIVLNQLLPPTRAAMPVGAKNLPKTQHCTLDRSAGEWRIKHGVDELESSI
jgi:hypothetical protein